MLGSKQKRIWRISGYTVDPGICGLWKMWGFFHFSFFSVSQYQFLTIQANFGAVCASNLYISLFLNSRLRISNNRVMAKKNVWHFFWTLEKNVVILFKLTSLMENAAEWGTVKRFSQTKTIAPHEAMHAVETTMEKLTSTFEELRDPKENQFRFCTLLCVTIFPWVIFDQCEVFDEVHQTQKYFNQLESAFIPV